MIEFAHITSLASALSIMRSLTYRPVQPRGGDAGLNGLVLDGRPVWIKQHFTGDGAVLFFEWHGPVYTRQPWDMTWDPQPDVLQDETPFRVFVPNGTTQHLRLVDIHLKPWIWRMETHLPWYRSILGAGCCRDRIQRRIQSEITRITRSKPQVIVQYSEEF